MEDKKTMYSWEPIVSILGGIFVVCFFWEVWTRGVYVMGLNATVFSLCLLYLAGKLSMAKTLFDKRNLFWALPIAIMSVSFFLYENPFFKCIHLLAFPALSITIFSISRVRDCDRNYWTPGLLSRALFGSVSEILKATSTAVLVFTNYVGAECLFRNAMGTRVVKALFILVALLCLVVPLLQSADPEFALRLTWATTWALDLFTLAGISKTLIGSIVAVLVLAGLIAWRGPITHQSSELNKLVDSVIAGIVLSGVLLVYLFFLGIQVERLWVNSLPTEFLRTEYFVKSGFWQLLCLSLINVFLFVSYYKKTTKIAQGILAGFAIASFFLVVSAAHRIALYVVYYGFSYEKFYAFYTVIFCSILIGLLTYASFQRDRKDIVRLAFGLLLWMYAGVSVFPVERFVFVSTVAMSRLTDSRMQLEELQMLSIDVLPMFLEYRESGKLPDTKVQYGPSSFEKCSGMSVSWNRWVCENMNRNLLKSWYELNLSDISYGLSK